MIFTELDFWLFFMVVFAGFAFIADRVKMRNAYLLLVSLFFYYKTSGTFLLLLLFSIIFGYYMAAWIYKTTNALARKLILGFAVVVHLGFLCYFKYAYFFASVAEDVSGEPMNVFNPLALLGNAIVPGAPFSIDRILLPVGISFFTFQILTYVIDVYRKQLQPVNSLVDFGFYVSFFPQLVAGPIVRASEFLPQLYRSSVITNAQFGLGVFLILKGLFKKMFIGDYIAINFIDRVFANPLSYTGFENVTALVAYSLQVYVDFSGYTDVAIGLSLLMGFHLSDNFNSPYKAVSVADFWRRWHISLSTFLRDYLYIPLGGNKLGEFRTNINLMITMLIGGLWHGASWNFVIWGGLNGIALLIYKFWKRVSPYEHSTRLSVHVARILFTFSFITLTRVFFRAPDLEIVGQWWHQVSHNFAWSVVPDFLVGFRSTVLVIALGFVLHWLSNDFKTRWRNRFINAKPWVQVLITAAVIFIIYQSVSAEMQPFIYFQF